MSLFTTIYYIYTRFIIIITVWYLAQPGAGNVYSIFIVLLFNLVQYIRYILLYSRTYNYYNNNYAVGYVYTCIIIISNNYTHTLHMLY